jgi:acid phosphatase
MAVTALLLSSPIAVAPASAAPAVDHIVVVIMENHSFSDMIGNGDAPFINELAQGGALFTNASGVAHPSQPNYLALFSGSTQNVTDDKKHKLDAPTLAGQLAAKGKAFVGYAEAGSPRKHNPWESFAESKGLGQHFTAFPTDFGKLPAVSFAIPDLKHDMHDGTVAEGDAWLRANLGAYAAWCATNNGLLILTFDEDDYSEDNRILTVLYGQPVKRGSYDQRVNHYTVLRTIEMLMGLEPLGHGADEQPITGVWAAP